LQFSQPTYDGEDIVKGKDEKDETADRTTLTNNE
jgi:hypothetical protein